MLAKIRFLRLFFVMLFIFFTPSAFSNNQNISLQFKKIQLSDAIRLLAKFLDMNVIISTSVTGTTTLQIQEGNAWQAFNILLLANGLAKWQEGNIWFVAPQAELIKRRQEQLKWQDIELETTKTVTKIWQIQYAKVEDIARVLQDEKNAVISKRGRVRMDVRTNLLSVEDIPIRIENVRQLVHYLDVPVKQIVIEARLASVDYDFERELGINFTVKSQLPVNNDNPGRFALAEGGRYSLAVAKLADGSLLDVKLSALEKAGHAELISNPRLFTANQQVASIEAGEEIPYQEVSESGGTAATFKKAVLGLKVTPQVLPGNKVLLRLQINQDRPSNKMVQGVPTITTRQIVTSVLVKNGETIVLGGIYETNEERGEERLPFISQIPVIGWLFKVQRVRGNKRELLIFVTPKIIA